MESDFIIINNKIEPDKALTLKLMLDTFKDVSITFELKQDDTIQVADPKSLLSLVKLDMHKGSLLRIICSGPSDDNNKTVLEYIKAWLIKNDI